MNVSESSERFYTGTPCSQGGHTLRYRRGGVCVECHSAYEKAKYQRNKTKTLASARAYREANPDKIKRTNLRRYGLTLDQYNEMLAAQGGGCAICAAPSAQSAITDKWFFVDHDHTTGKVRGLLCNHCNRGLGAFKDNLRNLAKAADYLLKNTECVS